MIKISTIIKKHWFLFIVVLIFILALFVRINNLLVYHTYWADDGGGHIIYLEKILNQQRLPTVEETYLAWHEPLYYIILAAWAKLGQFVGLTSINFWESFNIILYFVFILVVGLLTHYYSGKNKWLTLLNVFLFSFIFTGVKLSAYVNNEVLAQLLILFLVLLFLYWQLSKFNKIKYVIFWSIILAIATQVKITVFVILFSVIILWLLEYIFYRKKQYLQYILVCLFFVSLVNIPWFYHKYQTYDTLFSINLYEEKPRQSILTSYAWTYFFTFNWHIFYDDPYWFSPPHSYFSILLSDSFADYYNLFNNSERIDSLISDQKILVDNGRYTTLERVQTMLWANRLGFVIALIWIIGLLGFIINIFRSKKITWPDIFIIIVLVGGWLALLYNNLRLPYPERGVLKAHFIYYTYPLLTLLAYTWWYKVINNNYLRIIILFGPIIIYIILAWPLIFLK